MTGTRKSCWREKRASRSSSVSTGRLGAETGSAGEDAGGQDVVGQHKGEEEEEEELLVEMAFQIKVLYTELI